MAGQVLGYSVHPNSVHNYQKELANKNQTTESYIRLNTKSYSLVNSRPPEKVLHLKVVFSNDDTSAVSNCFGTFLYLQ